MKVKTILGITFGISILISLLFGILIGQWTALMGIGIWIPGLIWMFKAKKNKGK